MDRVDAKTIHPALQPEAQYLQHRALYFGIAPVEIRLLLQERVLIILARGCVELPRGPAELGEPVVGRPARGRWISPHVPVALRIVTRAPGFDEPRVLIGGVVGDVVQDDAQAESVSLEQERVKIGKRAEARVDVAVVGHVVAKIRHR